MKRILLTVAAVFAMNFMNAQEIKYGAKAGLNISTLTGDVEDAKAIAGFHVGGFVEFKVAEKFSIQPELLFSTQGAKQEFGMYYEGFDIDVEDKIKLSYLNVPIMAKYYVIKGLSIEAGPQIGFLLSAKEEAKASVGWASESGEVDIKDELKSIDFGFNLGAGYEFTQNIFVQARYNFGLTNIGDDSDVDLKNGVLQLSFGYKF